MCLCGCRNMPESYAPPVQRQPFENFRPYKVVRIVNMADAEAPAHFVQDISPYLEANWRWGLKRPTVKVRTPTNENLVYTADFTVPPATFKDTGPVTISFFVNDHLLDQVRYASPGPLHFEKKVPADWILPRQDNTVAAEIDKMWVSKKDGSHLGFILTRIGLTQ